jgi:ribosomal protein S18 acetylase RimI-like enzyme
MTAESSVHAAGAADVDQLSRALADAFEDDPVWAWVLPQRRGRHGRLLHFFHFELQQLVLPAGRVLANRSADGACLELPTDGWQMPVAVQLRAAVSLLRVFGRRMGAATKLSAEMEKRHPTEPHYYIAYVGVAPTAQGQGLGTALMGPTLQRCDSEGLPAYLEATNERNAGLYERLGFEHLGSFTVLDSPPLWAMRRPPR